MYIENKIAGKLLTEQNFNIFMKIFEFINSLYFYLANTTCL